MSNTARILIVDDERSIRLTLVQALESIGRTVEAAVNGEEALLYLERERYQVILLDLQLSGMDGLEVLKRVRSIQPGAAVIIITAHGSIDAAVEAMKRGAADFLQKPFIPDEVRQQVDRLFARLAAPPDGVADYFDRLARARQLLADDCLNEAELEVKAAIALDPDRPAAFNLMGAIHEQRQDPLTAIREYRAALALAPSYEPAQRNLERLTTWPRSGRIVLDERIGKSEESEK
jgi:DNA-binding response OmpR family regulator